MVAEPSREILENIVEMFCGDRHHDAFEGDILAVQHSGDRGVGVPSPEDQMPGFMQTFRDPFDIAVLALSFETPRPTMVIGEFPFLSIPAILAPYGAVRN